MSTQACKDKIIKSLDKDYARDKTLKGELRKEDADREEVLEFL